MDTLYSTLAIAALCAAALCVYLAAPRQQWLERPWPAVPGRGAGALLALLALALCLQVMQLAAAIFTLLTLGMALFIALPYLAALRQLFKGGRAMDEIRNDWLSKTLAGTLLGFALAMAIAGLVAWATPGGPAASNKFQFVMWLVSPIWVGVLSFCYLFRNGRSAWFWLGAANVVAFGGLFACSHLMA